MPHHTINDLRQSLVQLESGDTAEITATGEISTSGLAMNAIESSVSISVAGKVQALGTAGFRCGILLSGEGQDSVAVAPTGNVYGAQLGMRIFSHATVVNQGTIEGGQKGIDVLGGLILTNSGTIKGGLAGVYLSGASGGPNNITNSGLIDGGPKVGIIGSAVSDHVVNTGTIRGERAAHLFHGDDSYDGRNGGIIIGGIDLGNGQDTAWGGEASDSILGGLGNDGLFGGGGGDTLNGGDDEDWIEGGGEGDSLEGGNHNDVLAGGAGADILDGGAGAGDAVWYSTGSTTGVDVDLVRGTGIGGEAAGDTLAGIEGIYGSYGNDALAGDDSENMLNGGGNVFAAGGAPDGGNDTLKGRGGNDNLNGEGGNDVLDGGAGADTLTGGQGNGDLAWYDTSATGGVTVNLQTGQGFGDEAEGDVLSGVEGVVGSRFDDRLTGNDLANALNGGGASGGTDGGNDTLLGGGGGDTLNGEGGHDRLDGGAGADVMKGGAGNDLYFVDAAGDVVTEARGGGYDTVYASGASFSLASGSEVEMIRATAAASVNGSNTANKILANARGNVLKGLGGNDMLHGYAGNDRLHGDAGNDTIRGDIGNDRIWGGLGRDVLHGGAGRDVFVFDSSPVAANCDRVADFNVADDSFRLDNKIFRKLGLRGTEKSPARLDKAFFSLNGHKDENDYVSYNVTTGVLTYDPDGSGSANACTIAILTNKPKTVSALDFLVI
jgi:Ca2+-binding RTX toxin-like protein